MPLFCKAGYAKGRAFFKHKEGFVLPNLPDTFSFTELSGLVILATEVPAVCGTLAIGLAIRHMGRSSVPDVASSFCVESTAAHYYSPIIAFTRDAGPSMFLS